MQGVVLWAALHVLVVTGTCECHVHTVKMVRLHRHKLYTTHCVVQWSLSCVTSRLFVVFSLSLSVCVCSLSS